MSIHTQIEDKLTQALSPNFLEVVNESHMHNVPAGSESHFKVIIVCQQFEGLRLLARHRMVNGVLKNELEQDVHALALHTYTISEWHNLYGGAPASPACRGGITTV